MAQVTGLSLEDFLPHRPPMILLDRVVETGVLAVVCEVDINPGVPFSDADGVPAYVGMEYMAQTVGVANGIRCRNAGLPIEIGFLLGTPHFKSGCQSFHFGQTIRIEVVHVWGENQLARFECTIKDARQGEVLQQAELNVFKPENLALFLQRRSN